MTHKQMSSKGGSQRTEKKRIASQKNLAKARKARWKKKQD